MAIPKSHAERFDTGHLKTFHPAFRCHREKPRGTPIASAASISKRWYSDRRQVLPS
ncbi:MAG: hypothetical protein ACREWG_17995 [Gammaproteobacteria bacterium]